MLCCGGEGGGGAHIVPAGALSPIVIVTLTGRDFSTRVRSASSLSEWGSSLLNKRWDHRILSFGRDGARAALRCAPGIHGARARSRWKVAKLARGDDPEGVTRLCNLQIKSNLPVRVLFKGEGRETEKKITFRQIQSKNPTKKWDKRTKGLWSESFTAFDVCGIDSAKIRKDFEPFSAFSITTNLKSRRWERLKALQEPRRFCSSGVYGSWEARPTERWEFCWVAGVLVDGESHSGQSHSGRWDFYRDCRDGGSHSQQWAS